MTTAHISEKGQITLPSAVRRQANLRPGMRVEVEVRGDEVVLRPVKSLRDLAGIFQEQGKRSTESYARVRELTEAAVAEEVAREGRS